VIGNIGTVKADYIKSVDYCEGYFYMADNNTLHIFKGLPGRNDAPAALIS